MMMIMLRVYVYVYKGNCYDDLGWIILHLIILIVVQSCAHSTKRNASVFVNYYFPVIRFVRFCYIWCCVARLVTCDVTS